MEKSWSNNEHKSVCLSIPHAMRYGLDEGNGLAVVAITDRSFSNPPPANSVFVPCNDVSLLKGILE
jgi:hypothetical protein